MKRTYKFVLFSIALVSASMTLHADANADLNTLTAKTAPAAPVGKKINHKNMAMFNIILEGKPTVSWRIEMAAKSFENLLKTIDTAESKGPLKDKEAAFVKAHLTRAMKPVQEFFAEVINQSNMVMPLIEESVIQNAGIKNSILVELLNSKNKTLEQFLNEKVTTLAALRSVSREISALFNDIMASLSPYALQELARVKQQSAQAQQARVK